MEEIKIRIKSFATKSNDTSEDDDRQRFYYLLMAFETILQYAIDNSIQINDYDLIDLINDNTKNAENRLNELLKEMLSPDVRYKINPKLKMLLDYLLEVFQ